MDDWDIKSRWAVKYRRIMNFIEELEQDILRDGIPFENSYALSKIAIPLKESINLPRKKICEGEIWGRTWESGYFHMQALIPESWKGKPLAAQIDIGGEGLVYSRDGRALYGITSGSAFVEHYAKDVYRIPSSQSDEGKIELWLEAAANNLFGVNEAKPRARKEDPDRHGSWTARVNHLKLCIYDEMVWQLHIDMRYLFDLWGHLDQKSVRASRILKALFEVTVQYKENPANAGLCRKILAVEMEKPANASSLSTIAIGHAHIDTAWLWRVQETKRKIARTFASQLDLMEKYPEYIFGASAPQHHQWIKEEYPDLWQRIKQAVQSGKWEPQGGMWVEADCNIPSGESLVRQIIHGKNFWMDEFGLDVRNCWIPDVFGYAGSMPQILRKSGIDFFLTQKLSWSKFNEFPHDTFRWRGIDGTEVVTHFPPEYTYNSYMTPADLCKAEETFHEKDFLDEFITLVGIGDGGGGAKEEHVEHVLRARDMESLPKARFGRSDELFQRLLQHNDELDVWVGELYLEYHRGTYTSQAGIKKNNRRLEQEIRAIEGLWTSLNLENYPGKKLDSVVKTLLLHQFHDIIPGSSIKDVYTDADQAYEKAFSVLDELKTKGAESLFNRKEGALTLYNCLSRPWNGIIALPADFKGGSLSDEKGNNIIIQKEKNRFLAKVNVPACGFVTLLREKMAQEFPSNTLDNELLILENDVVRYCFNEDGQIEEAWDKEADRSILKPGQKGNVLAFFQDSPHKFDAWDIDFYYRQQFLENAKGQSFQIFPRGPLRQGLQFDLLCGKSSISQYISLENDSKVLVFQTTVDWKESQRMLRAQFPLDSMASEASCETAFGHVKRPTHTNTEWDFAKFEVCAHRWVDISDADYGVGLMNDCKYGHSVQENILDLTLLRSPLYPDPDADLGIHDFSYALVPHAGDLKSSDLIPLSEAFNRHPLIFEDYTAEISGTPITFESEDIVLEALKKGEKENVWIIRLVETSGRTSPGIIQTELNGAEICITDLMEWKDEEKVPFREKREVQLKPFEIRTYKISV